MNIPQLQTFSLDSNIWGLVVDEENEEVIADIRNEKDQEMQLVRLTLTNSRLETFKSAMSWWSHLLGVSAGKLLVQEYLDRKDPNQTRMVKYHLQTKEILEVQNEIGFNNSIILPSVYTHGSAPHRTVNDFLQKELPLATEYLEWQGKIIISYYLRSNKGFDRFLLLLDQGQKLFELEQDREMKGFSPGSFFVFKNRLIFIKHRNEICVYAS